MIRTIVMALAVAVTLSAQQQQPSGEDIIRKSMDAQGGAEKIKTVKTVQFTGKAIIGGKIDAPIVYRAKRPIHYRTDIEIQGHHMTEAFDGAMNWIGDGTNANKAPEANAKRAADLADPIGSPLFNYREKGNTVEFLGKEEVDGLACFKFKVKMKSGNLATVYVDQKSFLTYKTVIVAGELTAETRLNDYRQVGNILLPFSNTIKINGQEVMQMKYDKAELNVAMDDALFTVPAAKK